MALPSRAREDDVVPGGRQREQLSLNSAVPDDVAKAPAAVGRDPLSGAVDPSRIEEVLQQLSPVAQDLVLIGGPLLNQPLHAPRR